VGHLLGGAGGPAAQQAVYLLQLGLGGAKGHESKDFGLAKLAAWYSKVTQSTDKNKTLT
jgi:hypothetical protein